MARLFPDFLATPLRAAILLASCVLTGCRSVERQSDSDLDLGLDSTASHFEDEPEADRQPAANPAGAAPTSAPTAASGSTEASTSAYRILSLKAMDRILAACPGAGPCGDSLFLKLGGITRLSGVVFDERMGDVLIYGEALSGEPALWLEDLVVALRNAWLAYVQQKGNRITYLHPGLSLEPTAAAIKDLQRIAQDIARIGAAGSEKALDRWKETCRRPYQVVVSGLPSDSRFAATLLRADYAMKALANGSENLGLHGFPGMAELRRIRFQGEPGPGGVPSPPKPSLTRYWLHPGNQEWEMGEGIVVLKRCPVLVMTEEMFDRLRVSDTSTSAPSDDLAEAFAYGFTRMYGKVAEVRPVFLELEGLFRLVAAAKLVRDRFPEGEAQGRFPALFQGYRLPSAGAAGQVPGIPGLQHFDHARNTPLGMEIERYWLPSCGGVSVAVEPSKAWIRRLRDPALSAFRKSVIASRPSDTAWTWEVAAGTPGYWSVLRERMRMQELGQRFPNLAFFRVRHGGGDGKLLELLDEDDHVLKAGNAEDVMDAVALRADARKVQSVFLELSQWPAGQGAAFKAAALAYGRQRGKSWVPVPVLDRPGWLHPSNSIFNPSADWEQGEPPLETLASGPYKGWSRVTFRFLTSSGGRTIPAVLHVVVKSPETAARLQEAAAKDFRAKLFIAYSPLSALLSVIAEFRDSLPGNERGDVKIVEDEDGTFELG